MEYRSPIKGRGWEICQSNLQWLNLTISWGNRRRRHSDLIIPGGSSRRNTLSLDDLRFGSHFLLGAHSNRGEVDKDGRTRYLGINPFLCRNAGEDEQELCLEIGGGKVEWLFDLTSVAHLYTAVVVKSMRDSRQNLSRNVILAFSKKGVSTSERTLICRQLNAWFRRAFWWPTSACHVTNSFKGVNIPSNNQTAEIILPQASWSRRFFRRCLPD